MMEPPYSNESTGGGNNAERRKINKKNGEDKIFQLEVVKYLRAINETPAPKSVHISKKGNCIWSQLDLVISHFSVNFDILTTHKETVCIM